LYRENSLMRSGTTGILGIFRLRRRLRSDCAQDDSGMGFR
jgi:hypothetical protein